MSRPRHKFLPPSCDQKENRSATDLATRFARISLDPLIWPLTPQIAPGPRHPSAFRRWFRRLVRPRG